MKIASLNSLALLALVACLSGTGCGSKVDPELSAEQKAELAKSRDELKKRGWINLGPVPNGVDAPKPAEAGTAVGEGSEAAAPAVDPKN